MEQFEVIDFVQPSNAPINNRQMDSSSNTFITANTIISSLEEIRNSHIIPVFTRDNEPLISQADFITETVDVIQDCLPNETILAPAIRLSHPVKGRIPEAKDKPASQLRDNEKTIYYERMMFAIDIPSITREIDGNTLTLTIGGVKSYSLDNLYSRSICDQHFKVFIGFQNRVCTNLCVWTDGYLDDLKVRSLDQLNANVKMLVDRYSRDHHLQHLKRLTEYAISEKEFAQIIGRCRMYAHLPPELRTNIPPLLFGDQQINAVVKDFYRDNSFCRDYNGDINLWRLYNLFTSANKSSYIDSFLSRSINAYNLVETIRIGLDNTSNCWYLN